MLPPPAPVPALEEEVKAGTKGALKGRGGGVLLRWRPEDRHC